MKTFLVTTAMALTFAGSAFAASANCELNRSTEFNPASEFYGQMVVRCGSTVVATQTDLEAMGVDIFDDEAVQAAVGGNLPARSNGSTIMTVVTKKGSVDIVVEDTGHDSRW